VRNAAPAGSTGPASPRPPSCGARLGWEERAAGGTSAPGVCDLRAGRMLTPPRAPSCAQARRPDPAARTGPPSRCWRPVAARLRSVGGWRVAARRAAPTDVPRPLVFTVRHPLRRPTPRAAVEQHRGGCRTGASPADRTHEAGSSPPAVSHVADSTPPPRHASRIPASAQTAVRRGGQENETCARASAGPLSPAALSLPRCLVRSLRNGRLSR
jgi:hypothetical protein